MYLPLEESDVLFDAIENMVYVDRQRGALRIGQGAEAVVRICEELGGAYQAAAWLRHLPRAALDTAYRTFAANRYRFFGQLDSCRVPTPEERGHLLP